MSKSALLDYVSTTAVQVATLPQGLWSLLATRTAPKLPSKDDLLQLGFHTALGGLIASGVSAFAQNIQAKGTAYALLGSRLSLLDLNWSSVGAAVVTGAAIGASLGIASYLSREGHRARKAANAMTSLSSPLNVDMARIREKGADPWAINRALEANPASVSLLKNAVLANVETLTHTKNAAVETHAHIALAASMMTNVGSFQPSVGQAKAQWVGQIREQMKASPGAQLLLDTLPKMSGSRDGASSLDMHAMWSTMLSEQAQRPNDGKFQNTFSTWAATYFKAPPHTHAQTIQDCLQQLKDMSPAQHHQLEIETNDAHALVASSLIGIHIKPTPVAPSATQTPGLSVPGPGL